MVRKQRSDLHEVVNKLWNITKVCKFWVSAFFINVDLVRCSMLSCIDCFILAYLMVNLGSEPAVTNLVSLLKFPCVKHVFKVSV